MGTNQETMKHAAVYSMAALAGRMVGFIMLPFYAHILSTQGYAVIGMLDVGMAFLVSLLAYGAQGAILRLYHEEKDPTKKPVVVSTGLLLNFGAAAVIALPFMILSKPISMLLLDDSHLYRFVVLALIIMVFELTGQAATTWLLIQSRSKLFATINLGRLLLGLSLNITLIVVLNMGLDGYFLSSLIVNMVFTSLSVYIALKDCGRKFDIEVARGIRDFTLPQVPGSIVGFVARQFERVLVRFQIDLSSVGILELGYKFPFLLTQLITTPFMQSWNTRRFEMADEPGAPKRIGSMLTLYLFLVCGAGMLLAVIIKPMLDLLTPPEFHLAYRIARIEIATLIFQGTFQHLSFGILYAKKTHLLSKLQGWSAPLKVLLAWILISTWGIFGAAYSAAIMALAQIIVIFKLSQRYYKLQLEWKKIGLIVGLASGLFLFLNFWDFSHFGLYSTLAENWMPHIASSLDSTFLGTWKDGKLPKLLQENTTSVADMIFKGTMALSYAGLLPFIHKGFYGKVKNKLLRR